MRQFFFFILVFAIFLCFIVFNLDHRCDVSLGFRTFSDIPVFLTSLFSFALGMLFVFPLLLTVGHKRKLKAAAKAQAEAQQIEGAQPETLRLEAPKPKAKEKFFKRKSSKKPDAASEEDRIKKETSPYGID